MTDLSAPEPPTPPDLDRFLATTNGLTQLTDDDPAALAAARAVLHECDQHTYAALGAALVGNAAVEWELLAELLRDRGRVGAARAVHVLCGLAAQFLPHAGQNCTVPARFDLDSIPVGQHPLWERAATVVTDLLSGAVTSDGLRVATGLGALSADLTLPVLSLLLSHVRNLIEVAASVRGDAFQALDALRPQSLESTSWESTS